MNDYEFIGVSPTSSPDEIEAALLTKYNEVRRLATHHDPTVALQANLDLQRVERARTTLLDVDRRLAYDASVGFGPAQSGLADPAAVLQRFATGAAAPPLLRSHGGPIQPVVPASAGRTDAWICLACHTANPTQTRFCKSCGTQIGVTCPNCQTLVESAATFCQKCGVNVIEAREKDEQEQRQQAILTAERQRREVERLAVLEPIAQSANKAWDMTKKGCLLYFIPFLNIASLFLWTNGVVNSRKALSYAQVPGDETYRATAKKAFWWSIIPLVLILASLAISVILWIVQFILVEQGY